MKINETIKSIGTQTGIGSDMLLHLGLQHFFIDNFILNISS